MAQSRVLRVGLCGAGVVGGGVLSILERMLPAITARHAVDLQVTKVLVRDPTKEREGFRLPDGARYVTDWKDVIQDVDMVVELMGGTGIARDVVFSALQQGTHVVTANKALVAGAMPELESLLEKRSFDVGFGYEAAVAGGIPIIRSLQQSFAMSDRVHRVAGIMNGTTNYMLTKMDSEGANYGEVLREAQAAGFAEADPTADVEGHDARAKLSILTRLALGCHVPEQQIPCTGISNLTSDDFEYAKTLGATIKLVGVCKLVDSSSTTADAAEVEAGSAEAKSGAEAPNSASTTVQTFVQPCVCPTTGILGKVNGASNVIEIQSDHVGASHLIGPGAGRYPTANSVVADMVAIATREASSTHYPFPVALQDQVPHDPDFAARFFVRLNVRDQTGIIMTTGRLCHEQGIGIHSVLQTPIRDPENVPFVITTDPCRKSQIDAFCAAAASQDWSLGQPVALPIVGMAP